MCAFFIFLQIVQEYERAVIFRLGRVVSGGAKGPGINEINQSAFVCDGAYTAATIYANNKKKCL